MNTQVQKFNVAVFGETYHLATDESQEFVLEAAASIDQLMRQIARESGILDARRIAVLAALQVAFQAQQMKEQLEQAVQEHARLAELIDREIYAR